MCFKAAKAVEFLSQLAVSEWLFRITREEFNFHWNFAWKYKLPLIIVLSLPLTEQRNIELYFPFIKKFVKAL